MGKEKTSSNWFFLDDGVKKNRPIDIDAVDEWLYDDVD